jgi:ribosome maturation factor RimP
VRTDAFGARQDFQAREGAVGESPLFICGKDMAFDLDKIRSAAQRVASSHGLDVVDVEYQGGAKHRMLRIFIEKNAQEREKLAAQSSGSVETIGAHEEMPREGMNPEQFSGVTHEDCSVFSTDFGTLLDVEELIPGAAEYTLEVSSPGLDRKLQSRSDYERFSGSLVKLSTFEPVNGNRHWQGRLAALEGDTLRLDLTAVKQKGKGKEKKSAAETVEIALGNVEKAQLIPEI